MATGLHPGGAQTPETPAELKAWSHSTHAQHLRAHIYAVGVTPSFQNKLRHYPPLTAGHHHLNAHVLSHPRLTPPYIYIYIYIYIRINKIKIFKVLNWWLTSSTPRCLEKHIHTCTCTLHWTRNCIRWNPYLHARSKNSHTYAHLICLHIYIYIYIYTYGYIRTCVYTRDPRHVPMYVYVC